MLSLSAYCSGGMIPSALADSTIHPFAEDEFVMEIKIGFHQEDCAKFVDQGDTRDFLQHDC